jgi:hypothetical protein
VTTTNPRLLTPPLQEEEIYPYRRVWRSLAIEQGIVLGIAVALFILVETLNVTVPKSIFFPVAVFLAVTPFALWLIFSWWAERFALQPRHRLLAVALIGALAANAVGIPLVKDLLQVDTWLSLSSAINRIIGYTFTAGIVQESIKYIVVNYTVGPGQLRTRTDYIAYSIACAVGYATVVNLHAAGSNPPTPDVIAARIFATCTLSIAGSIIVSYGLSELHFGKPSPLLLTLTLALAAIVIGISTPVRSGLINTSLSFGINETRPLFGIVFSTAVIIGTSIIVSFLYDNAERRTREAALANED